MTIDYGRGNEVALDVLPLEISRNKHGSCGTHA